MTVAKYEAAFARLEHFAQVFDAEEWWAKRFKEGLQPGLKLKVMAWLAKAPPLNWNPVPTGKPTAGKPAGAASCSSFRAPALLNCM